jgi:hypothetical protein
VALALVAGRLAPAAAGHIVGKEERDTGDKVRNETIEKGKATERQIDAETYASKPQHEKSDSIVDHFDGLARIQRRILSSNSMPLGVPARAPSIVLRNARKATAETIVATNAMRTAS